MKNSLAAQSWKKTFIDFFTFSTISVHHKWRIIIITKRWIYELSKNLRLTILGNLKKIIEMLGTHGQLLSWLTKRKTLAFVVQNCEKPAVKHSIEKPVTPVT